MLRMLRSSILVFMCVMFTGVSTLTQEANAQEDTEQNLGNWIIDIHTGCKVWNGFAEPEESVTWSGLCDAEGYASGEGTLQWFLRGEPNGTYTGERQGGMANGYGVNVWVNGDRYEGFWKDEFPDGKGTYTWAEGSIYQGDWVEGQKHGLATYIWPNGDRFEGSYKDDKPFGGLYIKADGRRYIAEISNSGIGPKVRFFTPEERAAIRTIGNRICHPIWYLFGLFDAGIIGFVEGVTDSRIQIRIVKIGFPFQEYQGVTLSENDIIWDEADNWEICNVY